MYMKTSYKSVRMKNTVFFVSLIVFKLFIIKLATRIKYIYEITNLIFFNSLKPFVIVSGVLVRVIIPKKYTITF